MHGLAGDFGTMSFPDLILYLGNKAATGTLVIERRSIKKSLSIRDGEVINAASNDPREYLGQFLINFGHLTEDQLNKAFKTQAETKVFLGRILVMIGLINEDVLRQVLVIKIRETVLGLSRWSDGTFRFARGVLPPEQDGVEVRVPLLDVHREAEFRETAWQAMLQIFPGGHLSFQIDEAKVPKDILPNSLDAKLFELVREGYSIDEISLRLHATDFHLYQRLYALFRQGVIKPVEGSEKGDVEIDVEEPDVSVGEELGVDEILKHAREALAQRRFDDAATLAARAAELGSSPEALKVLKEAEAGYLDELRRAMLDPPKVPRLVSQDIKLKSLPLSPQEKYLLSRIDGARDIKAIIGVSPVRELDALRFFRGFVDKQLVTLS